MIWDACDKPEELLIRFTNRSVCTGGGNTIKQCESALPSVNGRFAIRPPSDRSEGPTDGLTSFEPAHENCDYLPDGITLLYTARIADLCNNFNPDEVPLSVHFVAQASACFDGEDVVPAAVDAEAELDCAEGARLGDDTVERRERFGTLVIEPPGIEVLFDFGNREGGKGS